MFIYDINKNYQLRCEYAWWNTRICNLHMSLRAWVWGLPSGCGDCHQAVGTAIRLWGQQLCTNLCIRHISRSAAAALQKHCYCCWRSFWYRTTNKHVDNTFFCVWQIQDEQLFLIVAIEGNTSWVADMQATVVLLLYSIILQIHLVHKFG